MTSREVVLLLLQLSLMLAVILFMGRALRKLGLPALVGELFGGILLGPTVLGAFSPKVHAALFPAAGPVTVARESIIQFGLLLFLFIAGLEVKLKHLNEQKRTITLTSLLGVSVPFLAGAASVLLWPGLWQLSGLSPLVGALLIGTILSISALPLIARILIDLNLIKTPFGAVVLAAATIDDLIGWTLFGVILTLVGGAGREGGPVWLNLLLILCLSGLIFSIGSAGGRRVLSWVKQRVDRSGSYVQLMLIVVLLAAACAEWIGTHAIFGAFLVGVAVARTTEARRQAYAALHAITLQFFVPLYLVSIGLRANFATHFDLLLVGVVLVVATFGKVVGAASGAWLSGKSRREAFAIGFALNARGAMGIVLTTVALDYGLIGQRAFVALIIMAVATSAMSAAVIPRLLAVTPPAADVSHEATIDGAFRVRA